MTRILCYLKNTILLGLLAIGVARHMSNINGEKLKPKLDNACLGDTLGNHRVLFLPTIGEQNVYLFPHNVS